MDFFLVVVLEFVLDGEAVGVVKSSDHVQEVALEAGQVVYQSQSLTCTEAYVCCRLNVSEMGPHAGLETCAFM